MSDTSCGGYLRGLGSGPDLSRGDTVQWVAAGVPRRESTVCVHTFRGESAVPYCLLPRELSGTGTAMAQRTVREAGPRANWQGALSHLCLRFLIVQVKS